MLSKLKSKKGILALVVAVIAAILAIGVSTGGAVAGSLITGHDVKNNSLQTQDIENHTILLRDLDPKVRTALQGKDGVNGTNGTNGKDGVNGIAGAKGDSGLEGAYYAVAKYNVGDTNQGAIATVACSQETDVAIDGQVQTLGLGVDTAAAAVASSFQGRMDWSTNTPKPNRADGWIFQFDAGNAPKKVTLKALCVPGASIPTVVTYSQDGS